MPECCMLIFVKNYYKLQDFLRIGKNKQFLNISRYLMSKFSLPKVHFLGLQVPKYIFFVGCELISGYD